ncbi:MAG: hypothetical protein ABIE07_10085 [Candidatus Zixiibacteriota bacterium]
MDNISIEKLKADGWNPQFTASGPRLAEALENYEMLGFEIKTVAVRDLDCGGCNVCFEDKNDKTVMIFTRKKN